jgi:Tol biopolymer transport system component
MFCTACATFNSIAARRCVVCGAGLAEVAGLSEWHDRRTRPARVRRGRRRVARLLSVVPLVVLLVMGGIGVDRYRSDRAALAAAYDRAAAAESAGRLDEAIVAYGEARGYRDADARRAAALAALAPYRSAYLDGVAALESGRFDEAIALLVPVVRDLPHYEDAAVRLAAARERRRLALLDLVEEAEARGDWLTAEQSLAQLLAENPDDPELNARLDALRRDHAPIAFTRDHQLYLIGPDLNDERLVTDEVSASWPVWSPDRTRLAFVAQGEGISGENRLFVVNADGSGLRELANHFSTDAFWPSWSPDGTRIAFSSQEAFDGPRGRVLYSVRVVDVESGQVTNATGNHLSFAAAPTWSPEGDRLAFRGLEDRPQPVNAVGGAIGVELFVLHLASGELRNVGQQRFGNAVYLTWSPVDDRLLIYGKQGATYRSEESASIKLLDLTTDEVTNINVDSQVVWLPVWSPDGSRIAYVEGDTVIRVRSSRGRGETWINVPSPVIGFLSWSPDGTVLLAAASTPKQPSFLIPLPRGGGLGDEEALPLVYDVVGPNAGPPAWSPTRSVEVARPPSIEGTAFDRG